MSDVGTPVGRVSLLDLLAVSGPGGVALLFLIAIDRIDPQRALPPLKITWPHLLAFLIAAYLVGLAVQFLAIPLNRLLMRNWGGFPSKHILTDGDQILPPAVQSLVLAKIHNLFGVGDGMRGLNPGEANAAYDYSRAYLREHSRAGYVERLASEYELHRGLIVVLGFAAVASGMMLVGLVVNGTDQLRGDLVRPAALLALFSVSFWYAYLGQEILRRHARRMVFATYEALLAVSTNK